MDIQCYFTSMGISEITIKYLLESASNIDDAINLYNKKKTIIEQLITELGQEEEIANYFAFCSNSYEEAANKAFATINTRRIDQQMQTSIKKNLRNKAIVPEHDLSSTQSIYLAAPGVEIEGREVISANRDEVNSMILDWYGRKPLDPAKIQMFPRYTVTDPTSVEYNCTICLNEYLENDSVLLLLPCYHFFHASCIENYFQYKNVCPMDNQEL